MSAITYLDATTPAGRAALAEVMAHAYAADIDNVPAEWALVRLADGVPVSFLLVDPAVPMDMPRGPLPAAFLADAATRADRRREGHFRGLVEEVLGRLRGAGHCLAVTHGEAHLYRPLGFAAFTHPHAIRLTAAAVRRALGQDDAAAASGRALLDVAPGRGLLPDLLLIRAVRAPDVTAARAALLAAAALAEERDLARMLIEEPPASANGGAYPRHASLETPLTALARYCGGEIVAAGADPEGGHVAHADWARVLDLAALLAAALPPVEALASMADGCVALRTASDSATVRLRSGRATVGPGAANDAPCLDWPAAAACQLALGYAAAATLAARYGPPATPKALALLAALYPPAWRLTRNESWTYVR